MNETKLLELSNFKVGIMSLRTRWRKLIQTYLRLYLFTRGVWYKKILQQHGWIQGIH